MKDILIQKAVPRFLGKNCPYWSLDRLNECGMIIGGVYLPMPHHINTFCLSSQYVKCSQYIRGIEFIMRQEQNDNKKMIAPRDRRKMKRFAERLYLTLVACDPNRKPQSKIGFKAMTLDMSLGGLKIECPQELAAETVVGFELAYDQSVNELTGVGKVKWCAPQQDSDKFEIGLSFADDLDTTRAIREHLCR